MTETQNDSISTRVEAGVGWITLNRPDQINAINDAIRTGVPAALRRFDADPALRVIALHGAGPRGFCAGADIKEARGPETPIQARTRLQRNAWIEAFDPITKPIVAVLHGVCMGGGLEIALACDVRIAAPKTVFALPEVNLGLIPGGGGTQRLPRLIGLGPALDILMFGDRFTAQEALRLGVVSRLAGSAESLLDEATALVQRLATKPPTALAYVKEAARLGAQLSLPAGLNLERNLFALLQDSAERREAAAAFREKRVPTFDGL